MPIDPRRRADIIAAVNAYNSANPGARLPRNAALLLAVMFGSDDTCQRSQEDLAAEGFSGVSLRVSLRRLVEAGLVSRRQASSRSADEYQLHLPPVQS